VLKKLLLPIIVVSSFMFSVLPASAVEKINPTLFHEWSKVDVCEEGGNWHYWSYMYPDGLGIDRANFVMFGGNPNKVNSIKVQIAVGMRFIAYYHMSIPDQQYGCGGSY
jgi:hypothetical protein